MWLVSHLNPFINITIHELLLGDPRNKTLHPSFAILRGGRTNQVLMII